MKTEREALYLKVQRQNSRVQKTLVPVENFTNFNGQFWSSTTDLVTLKEGEDLLETETYTESREKLLIKKTAKDGGRTHPNIDPFAGEEYSYERHGYKR